MAVKQIQSIVKDHLAPEDTILVHGTSVEAALGLLREKKLTEKPFSYRPKKKHRGYLFFTANVAQFTEHPFGAQFDQSYDWKRTFSSGAFSGRVNGICHYLASRLGYYPEKVDELIIGYERFPRRDMPDWEKKALEELISECERNHFSRAQVMNIFREANTRKGVVLGVGKNIFELKLEGPKEEKHEVSIYLPEGLDIKYVCGIVPCGELERNLLKHA